MLFRPSETKLRNAKTKDYMGKAKLISAADARDEYTAFTGITRLRQGQLPGGAPLEPAQTSIGSFSARAAEVASARSGLTRSATAAARVENSAPPAVEKDLPPPAPTFNRGPGSGISRSITVAVTGAGGGGSSGVTRGLSLRYQKEATDSGSATAGAAGVTRQMTQLNVRDRNEPRQPQRTDRGAADARLTEIYADYLGEDEPSVPIPPNAMERVTQWAKKTTPGVPAPRSGAPSVVDSSPSTPSGNDRLRQNVGVPLRRNNTGAGPGSVVGSMKRKVTRRPTNAGARAPSSYRGMQDRSTVYDDEEEEGYVSGEYEDFEYDLTKLRVKVNTCIAFSGVEPDLNF